jgi:transposase
MIALNRRTKIFVCKEATDMRASYDSLYARARDVLKRDPRSGHLFLFVNRARNSCKALYYDGTGFVILSKRLERGQFSRLNPMYPNDIVLTEAEFGLFFEGANLEKRFIARTGEAEMVESPEEVLLQASSSPPRSNSLASASRVGNNSAKKPLQTASL